MTKSKKNLTKNNKEIIGENLKKNKTYNNKNKHHDQKVVLNAKQLKKREYYKKIKDREAIIKQPIICKYFLYGSCKFDDCTFSHNVTADQMMKFDQPCRYYSVGECAKGEMCCFLHQTFPCQFFHNKAGNRCNKAEYCLFSHDPLTPEMKAALEKYIDFQKNRGKDLTIIDHEPETPKSIQVDFGKSIIFSKNNEDSHPVSEKNNQPSFTNISFGKNCLLEKENIDETGSEKLISSDESDKDKEEMEVTPGNVTVHINNYSIISKTVPVSSFTNLFNQHNHEDSDTAEETLMETKSLFENDNHIKVGESFQSAKTHKGQTSKDNLNILESLASNLNNIPTFTKLFNDSDSEDELKICENSSTRQSLGNNSVNTEINIDKPNNVYSTSFQLNNNEMIKKSQSHTSKNTVEKSTFVTGTAVDFSSEGRYPLRKRMSSINSMNGPALKINKTCEKVPLKNNFKSKKSNIENFIETQRTLYTSQPDLSVKEPIISSLLSKRKSTELVDSILIQNENSNSRMNKFTNFDEERLTQTKYSIFGSDSENECDESQNINKIELQQKNEEFSMALDEIPEFDWSGINQGNMFSGTDTVHCPDSDDDIQVGIKAKSREDIHIPATKKTSSRKLKHKSISSNKKEIKLIPNEKSRKVITIAGELKTNGIKSQQVIEEMLEFDWSGINQESMFSIAPVIYPDSDDDIKAELEPKDGEAIDRSNTKKSSLKFEQENISSESNIKRNGDIKIKVSKLKIRGSNNSIKKTKSKRISKVKSKLTPSIIDTDSDYQKDELLEDRIHEKSCGNGFSVQSKESKLNIDERLRNSVSDCSVQKQNSDRISKTEEKLKPSIIDTDLDCGSNVLKGSSTGKSIKRCKNVIVPTIKKSCTKLKNKTNLVLGGLTNSDLFSFSPGSVVPLPPIAYPDSDNDDVIRTISSNTSQSQQDDLTNQTNNNRIDLAPCELPNSDLFSFSSGSVVPLPSFAYPDSDNDETTSATLKEAIQSWPDHTSSQTSVLTAPIVLIDPHSQDHDVSHQSLNDNWAPIYLDLPPKLQYHDMDIDCYKLSHKFYDPRIYNHPKALKPNWADWLNSR